MNDRQDIPNADALGQSEHRLRRIADTVPGILYIYDLVEQRNLWSNRGMTATFGYTPRELEGMHGRYLETLVHPDDVVRFATHAARLRALPDHESAEFEFRARHADGSWIWLFSREMVFRRDAQGHPSQIVGAALDITERKRVQAALAESEQRLRLALDAAGIGVYAQRLDGRPSEGDDRVLAMFGFRPGEWSGDAEAIYQRIVSEDRPILERVVAQAIAEGRPYECEFRVRHPDGSVRWLNTRGRVEYGASNVPLVIRGVNVDVTDRKDAEERVREGDLRLRIAKEAAGVGIYDYRIDSGAIDWDPAIRDIWGVEPDEIVTFGMFLDGVHADDRSGVERSVRAAFDPATGGHYVTEYRVVNRLDGRTRWVETTGQVLFEGARPVRVIGSIIDISARKNVEEELRLADRRKDEFLAMLGHEFRNPLAPIRNAVQIMRLVGPKDPVLESARDIIDRQVAHLVGLVDDLMDVARVSQGKIQLQRQMPDLAAVIRAAVETSQPEINARRHALHVDLPDAPLHVEGDFVRLKQVVCNLLGNAARYTDEGGRIRVALETSGDRAIVRVQDNGRGIAPRDLPRVFDLFYQGDQGLDRPHGGMGIGLSLVRTLVEMHGGSVEAASEGVGHGSEFVIRLPMLHGEHPVEDARAREAGGSVAPLRILVADDSRDATESLATLLRLDGHQVSTAFDGAEAVERALAERPDAVLLDLGLPKLDGFRACHAMREGGMTGTLIVAVTGYGQQEDQRRSKQAGFDAHLVKPVDHAALNAALARTRRR